MPVKRVRKIVGRHNIVSVLETNLADGGHILTASAVHLLTGWGLEIMKRTDESERVQSSAALLGRGANLGVICPLPSLGSRI